MYNMYIVHVRRSLFVPLRSFFVVMIFVPLLVLAEIFALHLTSHLIIIISNDIFTKIESYLT